jgi:3-oxoacyl-[acyl-carrier-protein] synthase III
MRRARITGTGHFLPHKILTNTDLEQMMDTTDEWIRQRTGIRQRHVCGPDEATSDLAAQAGLRALENAGTDPSEVQLVLLATTSPDHMFPSTACLVQDRIGARNAGAVDLNAACSGFVYGLTMARGLIESGLYETILLIGAESITKHINWSKRDTAVLFGDGAGAVVLRPDDTGGGVLTSYLGSDGGDAEVLIMHGGGSRIPTTRENVGTELFDIQMRGQDLFKKAVTAFGGAIARALDDAGLEVADLDLFVPHQANTRIIRAAASRSGIPGDKVYTNIDRVANTTAASIPIALDDAVREGRIHHGSNVLVASFGSGLTWGSSLIRW